MVNVHTRDLNLFDVGRVAGASYAPPAITLLRSALMYKLRGCLRERSVTTAKEKDSSSRLMARAFLYPRLLALA
jgi:hypothetical protein